jgi:hypothetical protein
MVPKVFDAVDLGDAGEGRRLLLTGPLQVALEAGHQRTELPVAADLPATAAAISLDMNPSECPQPRHTATFPAGVCRSGAFG